MVWLELLSDYTFQNVVIGASLLGLISGPLGCFAVLRRQSLLGDAISHAALPGICLSFIITGSRDIGGIIIGSLITGSAAALIMLMLTRLSRLKTDAALGACLSIFFAVGIVLLTYIQSTNNASQGGLEAFLFGQAAATLRSDLWVMGSIAHRYGCASSRRRPADGRCDFDGRHDRGTRGRRPTVEPPPRRHAHHRRRRRYCQWCFRGNHQHPIAWPGNRPADCPYRNRHRAYIVGIGARPWPAVGCDKALSPEVSAAETAATLCAI